ncbi:hypothetical protein [Hymenobacter chitinivorans]|uniref:Two component regulator with propeller domain n=1 Tax=Hymenobacter chitinivorans DSM 11115 TaxID=1121954 RepID=A0A2M9BP31_9BACT|nr:hypothetical protein [Hymenobacter chitinivorans]PJJ59701.1 hypothetical protein CLV45_1122 [Hymenobacter chitinivorans DSM 11115]
MNPAPISARVFRPLALGLLLLLLTAAPPLWAGPPRRYALESQERPVALLSAGRTTYLITEHSIYQRQGRQFVRRYQSPALIRCALATDTLLWLGTQEGLRQLPTATWQAQPLPAAETAAQAPITTLVQDAAGTIWVGAAGYGVFQLQHGHLLSQLSIPTINAGLVTADSSVWLATNLGLHRWQHQRWTRYNEEGVANHEIPDNIVEKLLPDNRGNVWVVMSSGISVFARPGAAEAGEEHLPTVRFIGRPGNDIYSVTYVPGQGHVFATAMGLLLLPAQPSGELAGLEPATTTDKIETPQLLHALTLAGAATAPGLLQMDAHRHLWVVQAGEVSEWSTKAFRKATQPEGNASFRRPVTAGLSAQ